MNRPVPKEWTFNSFSRAGANDEPLLRAAGLWLKKTLLLEDKDGRSFEQLAEIRVKAGLESPNTVGGFLVPDQIEDLIISLRNVAGVFRQHARVRPMGSDSLLAPRRVGGLSAAFVGEAVALTESNATWDNVSLVAKKLGVLTRISSELADDNAVELASWFVEDIAWAFANKEDDCGFNGDGSQLYGGIRGLTSLLLDGNHNAGKVAAAGGHGTFATLDGTDLSALIAAVPEFALSNASWYASSFAIATTFARLGVTSGATIDTIAGPRPQLSYLGFPIVPTPKLPGSGSQTGKVMLLFGDLRLAATLGNRRGVTVRESRHRFLELDQVGIRGTERFDAVVHDLGDNITAGPIVGLVGG